MHQQYLRRTRREWNSSACCSDKLHFGLHIHCSLENGNIALGMVNNATTPYDMLCLLLCLHCCCQYCRCRFCLNWWWCWCYVWSSSFIIRQYQCRAVTLYSINVKLAIMSTSLCVAIFARSDQFSRVLCVVVDASLNFTFFLCILLIAGRSVSLTASHFLCLFFLRFWWWCASTTLLLLHRRLTAIYFVIFYLF